jgi:flagellar hook assembly protein FlgD
VALGFAGAHPVRGAGRFRLRQPEAGPVWAAVYDVRGRAVATLARGDAFPAGESVLAWDGRTARGAVAPAGVYQLRAVTRTGEATLRFVDIP